MSSYQHKKILHLHRCARVIAPQPISQGLQYRVARSFDDVKLELPELPYCSCCCMPFIPGVTVETRIRFRKLDKRAFKKATQKVHRKRILAYECRNCYYITERELDFQISHQESHRKHDDDSIDQKEDLQIRKRPNENTSARKRTKARKQGSSILRQMLANNERDATDSSTLDLFSFIDSTK